MILKTAFINKSLWIKVSSFFHYKPKPTFFSNELQLSKSLSICDLLYVLCERNNYHPWSGLSDTSKTKQDHNNSLCLANDTIGLYYIYIQLNLQTIPSWNEITECLNLVFLSYSYSIVSYLFPFNVPICQKPLKSSHVCHSFVSSENFSEAFCVFFPIQ